MYALITGKILEATKSQIIVECNNIGYYLNCPENVLSKHAIGETVTIYIHTIFQNDTINLYGFLTRQEKEFFTMLINASGVGAKIALLIISSLGLERASSAIVNEDINVLKQIPGIGEKLAKRIMLDLKDKVSKDYTQSALAVDEYGSANTSTVLLALINLGYSRLSAQSLVTEVLSQTKGQNLSDEELLRACLQQKSKI